MHEFSQTINLTSSKWLSILTVMRNEYFTFFSSRASASLSHNAWFILKKLRVMISGAFVFEFPDCVFVVFATNMSIILAPQIASIRFLVATRNEREFLSIEPPRWTPLENRRRLRRRHLTTIDRRRSAVLAQSLISLSPSQNDELIIVFIVHRRANFTKFGHLLPNNLAASFVVPSLLSKRHSNVRERRRHSVSSAKWAPTRTIETFGSRFRQDKIHSKYFFILIPLRPTLNARMKI